MQSSVVANHGGVTHTLILNPEPLTILPMKTEPVIYFGRTISPDEMEDHKTGLRLIELLNLRVIRSGEDRGRVRTSGGTKNPCGLARIVQREI